MSENNVTVDPITEQKILPCPFCAATASVESVGDTPDVLNWSVGCNNTAEPRCYGYESLTSFARRIEAINAWNRRWIPSRSLTLDADEWSENDKAIEQWQEKED